MRLSFRNRIALNYMIATAVVVVIVFGIVFFLVQGTVYHNLDRNLTYQAEIHSDLILIEGDSIRFDNMAEWKEREHREVQINPVFIQITDRHGKVMDRSPNLKEEFLEVRPEETLGGHYNGELHERAIRQVQVPIEEDGEARGFILAAMSTEPAQSVILKLRNVLFVSYWFILVGLYFVSRYLAGRSIIPIRDITDTTNRITKNNLQKRVRLPAHRDELYALSSAINELLDRIGKAIERERQFTSDASHELRTPLAALRGTLEILIRKPRSQEEYETKIRYSLAEISRMSSTIDQLLLLARMDGGPARKDDLPVQLRELIEEVLSRHVQAIADIGLRVDLQIRTDPEPTVPRYHAHLILDNIIGNAVKYSLPGTVITVITGEKEGRPTCTVRDQGIGIHKEDHDKLFDRFFRSGPMEHRSIPGNGLGLAIVKKAADAIGAELSLSSIPGKGTEVVIVF